MLNSTESIDVYVSNNDVGKAATLRLYASGSDVGLDFDGNIIFVGEKPTALANSKYALLSLTCFGPTKDTIIASYAPED